MIYKPIYIFWAKIFSILIGPYFKFFNFFRKKYDIQSINVKTILVTEYHRIGDVIIIAPILRSIKLKFPNSKIILLCNESAKELAEYLKLAEQARTEMLRLRGLNYNFLKTNYNAHFAIHSLSINYSIPLKLDDEVIIKTFVKSLGGASIKMEQNFILYNSSEDSLISRLNIKVVLVNDKGSLIRLPKNISDELKCLVV